MITDYSKQLDQIAQALNRPGWPAWLVALLAAGLAVVGGIIGQFFLLLMNNRRAISKMRLVLYKDMAAIFTDIRHVMGDKPALDPDLYRRQF